MKARTLTRETILNVDAQDRGFPEFRVGDSVEVSVIVTEGNKERVQVFAGDVIAMRGQGISQMFTVRRQSVNNIWVEKIFPLFSPIITDIKVTRRGKVRRAKLYYLRDRIGKAARITELVLTKEQKEEKRKKAAATKKKAVQKTVEQEAEQE